MGQSHNRTYVGNDTEPEDDPTLGAMFQSI